MTVGWAWWAVGTAVLPHRAGRRGLGGGSPGGGRKKSGGVVWWAEDAGLAVGEQAG